MPFAPAAQMLRRFTGVGVSPATAWRLTEVVGRAGVAVEEADVARRCDALPPVPAGPERAARSARYSAWMGRWCPCVAASGPRSKRWGAARGGPRRLPRRKHTGPDPLLAERHQQVAALAQPPPAVTEALT